MTDKQRVEHILNLRKEYLGRGVYRGYIQNEVNTRLGWWINLFCKLNLWDATDEDIILFYQELAAQISYSRWECKERKRKGYERLKNHLYPFTWLGHKHINKIQQYERVNNIT